MKTVYSITTKTRLKHINEIPIIRVVIRDRMIFRFTRSKAFEKQVEIAKLNLINEEIRVKDNSSLVKNGNCPEVCLCQGLSIDCNNRELTEVPRNLPKYIIKM